MRGWLWLWCPIPNTRLNKLLASSNKRSCLCGPFSPSTCNIRVVSMPQNICVVYLSQTDDNTEKSGSRVDMLQLATLTVSAQ